MPDEFFGFDGAINKLKEGHKVAREGWNGTGMWVALTPASSFRAEYAKDGHASKHRAAEFGMVAGYKINLAAHIDMRAADGTMVVGWAPSQTDMLAEDWHVVE